MIHNKVHTILFFLFFLGFKLYGETSIKIIDNYVKKPLKGIDSTAAYFEVVNTSKNKITLRDIKCEGVTMTSFHKMEMNSESKLMRMKSLKSIELAPNSIRKFSPIQEHIMMMGLADDFKRQNKVICTLYANDNEIIWSFPLK